jgi:hypothetical protein
MSDLVDGYPEDMRGEIDKLRAEVERLREGRDTMGNLWAKEKERVVEAAAFLDGLADRLPRGIWEPHQLHDAAADCRAMAAKLRGQQAPCDHDWRTGVDGSGNRLWRCRKCGRQL